MKEQIEKLVANGTNKKANEQKKGGLFSIFSQKEE
jgi:hypothetical protein